MQLFEIFKYLFNRDQLGHSHAICLYFASRKLLHSPDAEPLLRRVSAYPYHSPDHARTHALPCVRAWSQHQVSTVTSNCVITVTHSHRLADWQAQ